MDGSFLCIFFLFLRCVVIFCFVRFLRFVVENIFLKIDKNVVIIIKFVIYCNKIKKYFMIVLFLLCYKLFFECEE